MSESRNRWMVRALLAFFILVFTAISALPMITAFLESSSSGGKANANGKATSEDAIAQLRTEAQGYELVLKREPNNENVLKGLLEARLKLLSAKQGSISDVIMPLERLVQVNPNEVEYAVLLAQAKEQTGDRDGAANVLRTVLTSKPGNMEALQAMVTLQLNQKRPEAAIGILQDTLTKAPQANKIQPGSVDTVGIQVMLANIYAEQKRFDKAFEVYDQASKEDSKDYRPLWAKALVLKEQGKTDEAKPLFSNAAAIAPADLKDEINRSATATPTPTGTATATPTATP